MQNRIVILGGAESGIGAAILAKKKGYEVFVSDAGEIKINYKDVLLHHAISFEEGKHTENSWLRAQEVVKSPGIPDKAPVVRKMKELGIPVVSEIEFAARYTKAKKICITGSNGKTTTSMLTFHILKKAGLHVGLAGNIGKSFAWQVAENDFDYYVLEISSFQLDFMFRFKADIAVITNITPDHLDRYHNRFQDYVDAKFRILQNQGAGDFFIYCADDPVVMQELSRRSIPSSKIPFSLAELPGGQGAYMKDNKLNINILSNKITMGVENFALPGKHNLYNSMAAGIISRIFDIRKEVIKESMAEFQGVEHRLEFVTKVHGIEFVNDSKATNVNSTWYALESMTHPVIWIVGGVDKGNDYSCLKPLVKDKVKAIICLGTDNGKLIREFGDLVSQVKEARSAEEAVQISYAIGNPGDVVLLSPACASFDLFNNYEDRGMKFKRAVYDL